MGLLVLLALGYSLVGQSFASPKVVSMPIRHGARNATSDHHEKRDPFAASLQNLLDGHQYFATAGVGTPSQELELVIDTGSSDTWMFGTGACHPSSTGPCIGGEFDKSSSKSFQSLESTLGLYKNAYGDGSEVEGPFFSDKFTIGGQTVDGLTMGLVNRAKGIIREGIMGIGLDTNEGRVAQGKESYQNLPDLLVSQALISSKSYSLYLDDLAEATGSVLFGGYDPAKYYGDMIMLPLQEDPLSGKEDAFFVSLSVLGLSNGKDTLVYSSSHDPYPIPVLLDSGTENINLPLELFEPFIRAFNLQPLESGTKGFFEPFQIDCDQAGKMSADSVVFAFGSRDGPIITVPIQELIVPFYNPKNGKQVMYHGKPFCRFGMAASGPGSPVILGQTFLRSAYALYDLENKAVGLAQAKYDKQTSNVLEYSASESNQGVKVDVREPNAQIVNYGAKAYLRNYPFPQVQEVHTAFTAAHPTSTPPSVVAATPAAATNAGTDNGAGGTLSEGATGGASGTTSVLSGSHSLMIAASMFTSLIGTVYML